MADSRRICQLRERLHLRRPSLGLTQACLGAETGTNTEHLRHLHRLWMDFKRPQYACEFFAGLAQDRLERLTGASGKIHYELAGVRDASEYIHVLKETRRMQSSDPPMDSTLGAMNETLKLQSSGNTKHPSVFALWQNALTGNIWLAGNLFGDTIYGGSLRDKPVSGQIDRCRGH